MRAMEKDEKIATARRQRMNLMGAILLSLGIAGYVVLNNSKNTTSSLQEHHEVVHLRFEKQKKLAVPNFPTEQDLMDKVNILDTKVRDIKATGVMMEVDDKGLEASKALQEATRALLVKRYGPTTDEKPYRVVVNLEFQPTMVDYKEKGSSGKIVLEMAPISLQPHSVYTFMEIARHWSGGAFHRNAGHVLQVMVRKPPVKHLAFQEYSPKYPHKKGTVGYAGRPSGPEWYISIQDNTRAHGPGSQQKENPHEADSCFGKVISGFNSVAVDRITKMGGAKGMGFVNDPKQHVKIKSMTIMVPSGNDYVKWKPSTETAEEQ